MRTALLILFVLAFFPSGKTQTNGSYNDLEKALENPEDVKKLVLYDTNSDREFHRVKALQNLEILEIMYEDIYYMTEAIGELKKLTTLKIKIT